MTESSVTQPRAPSAETVRTQIAHFVELWVGALFLKRQAYAYERDQRNGFANGLLYIAIIGVIVALAGIAGAGLRYATSPSVEAIQAIVLSHLVAMPFFDNMSGALQDRFLTGFNQTWNALGSVFVGYPTNASGVVGLMLSVVTTPLGLILGWLVYGGLVHLIGRRWNRETSFSELLAPLALATTPQLIRVLTLFPGTEISTQVISLWTFICSVVAIRIAYNTTTRRAVWGAFFPVLVFGLLILAVVILAIGAVTMASRSVGQ